MTLLVIKKAQKQVTVHKPCDLQSVSKYFHQLSVPPEQPFQESYFSLQSEKTIDISIALNKTYYKILTYIIIIEGFQRHAKNK